MSFRLGYCIVSVSPVRSEQRDASEIVTQLLFGEIVTIEEMQSPWCKISTYSDNYHGYVDLKHIHFLTQKEVNRWLDGLGYQTDLLRSLETPWGNQLIYRGSFVPFASSSEEFSIGNDHFRYLDKHIAPSFHNPVDLCNEYINTPYLWGGKTPFGIDCSGLTQTVFRFFEINLPRDASQQVEYGMEIHFDDIEAGDVAFFTNDKGKVIHVGVLDGDGMIIHASGFVRKDLFTSEGIIHNETGQLTHNLCCIRRM